MTNRGDFLLKNEDRFCKLKKTIDLKESLVLLKDLHAGQHLKYLRKK